MCVCVSSPEIQYTTYSCVSVLVLKLIKDTDYDGVTMY